MATKEPVVVEQEHGTQALATVSREAGVMALAALSDQDFEARLLMLKKGQERVRRIQMELMEEGEDYGVIPGTKRPTLLKPGAEKLCHVYGLVATYQWSETAGDGLTAPPLRVVMECHLHRGDTRGPVVGVGVGAANSWERKHRYRGAQRSCPACGCEGTIRRSRYPDRDTRDKGWYCHDKAGGCGAQFHSGDPSVMDQEVGQVENPDPYDVQNSLLKMARKRSYIDATLTATATSGLFTQDVEDLSGPGHDGQGGGGPASAVVDAPMADTPSSETPARPPRRPAAPRGTDPAKPRSGRPACPQCSKAEPVIDSKFKPGTWVCWEKSSPVRGCGYKFGLEDLKLHADAAAAREASGEDFQVSDDDVPF